MDFLTSIPPSVRKALYQGFFILGVVFGGVQVGFATGSGGTPGWLTTTLVVYAYVGTALGLTAASNVKGTNTDVEDVQGKHERDV